MSQVVLITGCSSGIGRDLVRHLSGARYTVVATARRVETLADLQAAMKLPLDVTDSQSIDHAVQATLQRFGRIDILINNAGYAVRGAVEEVPVEQTQKMFDANVFGVMRMIRAVVPHMRERGVGRIINISSVAGLVSIPFQSMYSASKYALESFSEALRIEGVGIVPVRGVADHGREILRDGIGADARRRGTRELSTQPRN